MEDVENILREVRQVLERIDELAKRAGRVVNTSDGRKANDVPQFSENVSQWLFNDNDKLKERNKLKEPIQIRTSLGSSRENPQENTDSPSFASFVERNNHSTNRFTNQLISHNLTSDSTYRSPRSRYLENRAAELAQIREKLSKMSVVDSRVRYSACDLVGSISGIGDSFKTKEPEKSNRGVVVSLAGGSYANVKSCVDKSKTMFGDSIAPDNPYFIPPWERRRNVRDTNRRRFIL